jgi:hypothetical protein
MPKRTDISKILILGSGPIIIAVGGEALKGRAFKARRKMLRTIYGFSR